MKQVLMTVHGLSKTYGEHTVLHDIDLKIYQNESLALVGKSGGGKSTLLRLIAGLEPPDSGKIIQNHQGLTKINAQARMMFQEARLLPWLSVLDNLTFADKSDDAQKKAEDLLDLVGLTDFASAYPTKLSGGQQQRVALARALFAHPRLLLLDEPLGALDALTRRNMQDLILKICQQKQITLVLVTHDLAEAVRMADRIALIKDQTIKTIFMNPDRKLETAAARSSKQEIETDVLKQIFA